MNPESANPNRISSPAPSPQPSVIQDKALQSAHVSEGLAYKAAKPASSGGDGLCQQCASTQGGGRDDQRPADPRGMAAVVAPVAAFAAAVSHFKHLRFGPDARPGRHRGSTADAQR